LRLWILDNGPGMSRDAKLREGIGMANTRARLEKYYGPAQSFRCSNGAKSGVRVDIRLPFRALKNVGTRSERETANADCR
jgi:two-component system, LytTR family, sensor kinase